MNFNKSNTYSDVRIQLSTASLERTQLTTIAYLEALSIGILRSARQVPHRSSVGVIAAGAVAEATIVSRRRGPFFRGTGERLPPPKGSYSPLIGMKYGDMVKPVIAVSYGWITNPMGCIICPC